MSKGPKPSHSLGGPGPWPWSPKALDVLEVDVPTEPLHPASTGQTSMLHGVLTHTGSVCVCVCVAGRSAVSSWFPDFVDLWWFFFPWKLRELGAVDYKKHHNDFMSPEDSRST